ncbi:MAG: AAA family ATPase [Sporolactobacillus sp.]
MKIKALEINQFGTFENKVIRFPKSSLIMIYGENEAGKSTLKNFILSVLFGFSSKNEWARWSRGHAEDRLGGSVIMEDKDGGICRFERFYSSKNQPRITSEHGEPYRTEEWLQQMDRLLYENVFCFDLDGLNALDKIRPADLNHLLLGAGMVGNQALDGLEQKLDRVLADLFKKGGKNPEINQLFHQLERAARDLKSWEEKMDAFRLLKEKIEAGNRELDQLEVNKKAIRQRLNRWTAFIGFVPLFESTQALEEAIGGIKDYRSFPADGLERHKGLVQALDAATAELTELRSQMNQVEDQRLAISSDPRWLAEEEKLNRLFRLSDADQENIRQIEPLKKARQRTAEEYRQLLSHLGPEWIPARLQKASIDLEFRGKLQNLLSHLAKTRADREASENALHLQEEQVRQLTDRLEQLHRQSRTDSIDLRQPKEKRNTNPLTFLLLLASGISALFSGLFINWAAAAVLFAFGFIWTVILALSSRRPAADSAAADDRSRSQQLQQSLAAEQAEMAQERCNLLKQTVLKNDKMFHDEREALEEWVADRGYPRGQIDWLEELVRLVIETKKKKDDLDGMTGELAEREKDHQRFLKGLSETAQYLDMPGADCRILEKRLEKEKEMQRTLQDCESQLIIYRKQIQRQKKNLEQLRDQQASLYEASGAKDRSDFENIAEMVAQRRSLQQKLETLRLEVLEKAGGKAVLARLREEWIQQIWQDCTEDTFNEQMIAIEKTEKETRALLIQREAECRSIENNDSYREVKDRYASLLAELQKKAEKWSVYQIARQAIQKVKDRYRIERMPQILQKAGSYLSEITSGVYRSLELTENEGFIACRQDGRRFFAAELSRGTAEQVYLSLRLALADSFSQNGEQMPIIVDEGFVNFDERRMNQVYRILARLAETRQIILLTCHQSDFMKEHPETILPLSALNKMVL